MEDQLKLRDELLEYQVKQGLSDRNCLQNF